MDYWEADQLSQKNKDFILSLFPSGKIYTTFLPAEARNAIGKVGKETEPVLHMLTKIGFKYRGHVDPFDGGPHLLATVDEILPVNKAQKLTLSFTDPGLNSNLTLSGLLCQWEQAPGEFRSIVVQASVQEGQIHLPSSTQTALEAALGVSTGAQVGFMPFY